MLALIVDVDPSKHVVVVDEEGEIEGEIDERSEHLMFQWFKVKIYQLAQLNLPVLQPGAESSSLRR